MKQYWKWFWDSPIVGLCYFAFGLWVAMVLTHWLMGEYKEMFLQ